MSERIENQNLAEIRSLASPRALKKTRPLSEFAAATVLAGRRAIRDVIHGRDARRLVVIVGPCSIHDPDAALTAPFLCPAANIRKRNIVIAAQIGGGRPVSRTFQVIGGLEGCFVRATAGANDSANMQNRAAAASARWRVVGDYALQKQ